MSRSTIASCSHRWQLGLQNTLSASSIPFAIIRTIRAPQTYTFRCQLGNAKDLPRILGLGEQLALNMAVESVRVSRSLGSVDLEIALPRSMRASIDARRLERHGGTWAALGLTTTGTPVHVNLAGNRTAHALIAGTTGCGKSVTERLIAWNLARGGPARKQRYMLIDGKGSLSWKAFDNEAHLAHPIIVHPAEAMQAFAWSVAELDRRKTNGQREPELFVIVDELRELLDISPTTTGEAVRRISATGRELGMHVIVATQHPLTDAVGGSITKANLGLRLTGRVLSSQEAYVATGTRASGAELLQGNGDFLVTVAGESHRLQIAQVSDEDLAALERLESVPRLDLDGLDLDHTLNVAPRPPELEPAHVALAMTSGHGIKRLQRDLSIGQDRATRVREFAVALLEALRARRYDLAPIATERTRTDEGISAYDHRANMAQPEYSSMEYGRES